MLMRIMPSEKRIRHRVSTTISHFPRGSLFFLHHIRVEYRDNEAGRMGSSQASRLVAFSAGRAEGT